MELTAVTTVSATPINSKGLRKIFWHKESAQVALTKNYQTVEDFGCILDKLKDIA